MFQAEKDERVGANDNSSSDTQTQQPKKKSLLGYLLTYFLQFTQLWPHAVNLHTLTFSLLRILWDGQTRHIW